MSGPAKTCPGGQVLTANQRKYFFLQEIHLSFCINKFIIFQKIICFIKQIMLSLSISALVWVGARSGLGSIWALMGPYGPMWALMGPPGQVLEKASTFRLTFRRDFWTNFARFGSKTKFFMKFLDDSASFLLEKLKKHVILTKSSNI